MIRGGDWLHGAILSATAPRRRQEPAAAAGARLRPWPLRRQVLRWRGDHLAGRSSALRVWPAPRSGQRVGADRLGRRHVTLPQTIASLRAPLHRCGRGGRRSRRGISEAYGGCIGDSATSFV